MTWYKIQVKMHFEPFGVSWGIRPQPGNHSYLMVGYAFFLQNFCLQVTDFIQCGQDKALFQLEIGSLVARLLGGIHNQRAPNSKDCVRIDEWVILQIYSRYQGFKTL